jgi:hypothetical protein
MKLERLSPAACRDWVRDPALQASIARIYATHGIVLVDLPKARPSKATQVADRPQSEARLSPSPVSLFRRPSAIGAQCRRRGPQARVNHHGIEARVSVNVGVGHVRRLALVFQKGREQRIAAFA